MEVEAEVGEADRAAILAGARDYIEGWLDGDAERMARCLHPDLAKRSVLLGADGCTLENITRAEMVAATAEGRGRKYARPYEIAVLDAFGGIATVRVLSSAYMDYLHIGWCGERWLIVNVLWQRRPGR